MQNRQKCYENVWILSGTSDGPIIARELLSLNYVVFVSVVSYKASCSYPKNAKLHIITGKLLGQSKIENFILENEIDCIIDATHPFALEISSDLNNVCNKIKMDLFRFERNFNQGDRNKEIISNLYDIKKIDLAEKNLLLAIGSRTLGDVSKHYLDLGVNVFARVLATPESVLNAFATPIKNSNIAILNPSKTDWGNLEKDLCKYWKIDYVLCRDSGGYSQFMWEQICEESQIKLFLVKRPEPLNKLSIFSTYNMLMENF